MSIIATQVTTVPAVLQHPAFPSTSRNKPQPTPLLRTSSDDDIEMAEQNAPRAENVVPLTEPPKEGEGEKGPSKSALKKAAKEKEKVCDSQSEA